MAGKPSCHFYRFGVFGSAMGLSRCAMVARHRGCRPGHAVGCPARDRRARRRVRHGSWLRLGFPRSRRGSPEAGTSDLVRWNFSADGPNALWVADITFIPTLAGFLFLAVVLDAWSRCIVGWSFSADFKTRLVLDALEMALAQRNPEDVIHHSDRGAQYTSIAFGARAREAGVRPSTGSVGRRLRQRHVRKLLRDAGMRIDRSPGLQVTHRGQNGRLPLHRGLLQSRPAPFRLGLPLANQL
jgi:transposase InsO family protein